MCSFVYVCCTVVDVDFGQLVSINTLPFPEFSSDFVSVLFDSLYPIDFFPLRKCLSVLSTQYH